MESNHNSKINRVPFECRRRFVLSINLGVYCVGLLSPLRGELDLPQIHMFYDVFCDLFHNALHDVGSINGGRIELQVPTILESRANEKSVGHNLVCWIHVGFLSLRYSGEYI